MRYLIFIGLWLLQIPLIAKEALPKVSVLTCAPGKEIYSIYGHNALRLQYEDGRDFIFNYGTFDFKTPNFTLKFIRGRLPYMLSVNYFPEFMEEYNYFRRSVSEQVLALDSVQTKELVYILEENLRPENRAYKYDFFYDNCATRIYDAVEKAAKGQIQWKENVSSEETFRSRIKEYQNPFPWTDFGIDIIIGSKADKQVTLEEDMFLPDYVNFHFNGAVLDNNKLVSEQNELLKFAEEKKSPVTSILLHPVFIFSILCLIEILLWFYKFHNPGFLQGVKRYDLAWFLVIFSLSLFILFMWFFTDHIPVKNNYNVLWTLPAVFYFSTKMRYNSVMLTGVVILWLICSLQAFGISILPQYFHPAFGMICLISILKWLRNYKNFKKAVI